MKKLTEIQKTSAGIIFLGAVTALIILILGFFPADTNYLTGVPTARPIDNGMTTSRHVDELEAPVATIAYQCAEGKTFLARVEVRADASLENPGHAEVFLNDGSKLLLTQTMSASGVRFANSGESFVYWIKGQGAFIQEGDTMLYQDCVGTER